MAPMTHSVEIDRRREDVFAYVTDPTHLPEWQEAVVRAGPVGSGPLQQGSRISLTRRMGKREQTMTSELTEYNPPESYAFRVRRRPGAGDREGAVRAARRGRADALHLRARLRGPRPRQAPRAALRPPPGGEGAAREPREPEEEARERHVGAPAAPGGLGGLPGCSLTPVRRGVGEKQGRQDSNLQPPVLEGWGHGLE